MSADVQFRKGKYEDVKSVFDSMNERDRRYVAPAHPDVYLDIKPDARTVAYISDKPVGFADLFDEARYIGEKGSRRASMEIAVMEAARRKGIARKLAIASIVKALKTGRFDDIDWWVVHGNDASVALAKKLGFRRRGIHWNPLYTIGKEDFNRAHELKKEAGIELRDGGIDDVRRVIAGLSDQDRANIVARGRTEYKDVPERLAARTVAYDGNDPVGFSDIYGVDNQGRVRSSPSITVAVLDKARGKRLAGKLANDAIDKVLARVERLREERGEDADRLRRFVWRLHEGNESSAIAAAHAGFTEQTFSKPHRFRQFVKRRMDAEKKAAAPTDDELRRMYDILQADAKLSNKVEGLGFGRNGEAYRRAAIKLRVMELARLLQDGKRIRNRIAHTPGYIPSEQDSERALKQYADADAKITQFLHPQEKAAADRNRIQAQYARHPQESLDRLAKRLAKKKWGAKDVVREDEAHAEEFKSTGEDKELLDRYIIARIAEQYDRRARIKQAIMRKMWERGHKGESFDAALPSRMARFRQYEDVPFGVYDNPLEQRKFDSATAEMPDDAWRRYLSNDADE